MRVTREDWKVVPRRHLDKLFPRAQLGKAAALLMHVTNSTPVTMVLTDRCNLTCDHCYWPKRRQPVDLEPDLAFDTIDELTGIPQLYFSGGEPFFWGSWDAFMKLVKYAAARVGRLYIDTNGMWATADSNEAVLVLSEFPKNVVPILSYDPFHARALAEKGRDASQIFRALQAGCAKNGLGFEVNVRLSARRNQNAGELFNAFEISDDWFRNKVHVNAVTDQGTARELPPEDTHLVSLADFVKHWLVIGSIGLFIRADGKVVSGDHAAFLENPPTFCIWGDLYQETLSNILWRMFESYAHRPGYFVEYDEKFMQQEFSPADAHSLWIHLRKARTRFPSTLECAAMMQDEGIPIDWRIDLRKEQEWQRDRLIIEQFDGDQITGFIEQVARSIIEVVAMPGISPKNLIYNMQVVVRKGKLGVEVQRDGYYRISASEDYRTLFKNEFGELRDRIIPSQSIDLALKLLGKYAEEKIREVNDQTAIGQLNAVLAIVREKIDLRAQAGLSSCVV